MNNPIIIFGINPFAQMIKYYVETYTSSSVAAFTVDSKYKSTDLLCGLPIVPFESIASTYPPSEYDAIVAVGYSEMNMIRQKKFSKLLHEGYTLPNLIHPTAHLENIQIGQGNIILENVNIGYNTTIGDSNILWNGCNISHEVNIGNYNYISPSTAIAGHVYISNNCFLGINSCVRNDITIQDYTLIGAGCYINQETEKYGVYLSTSTIKVPQKSSLDIVL